MIVVDASAAIDWLLQTAAGRQIEERIYSQRESLHAPHVLDLEVVQVIGRMVRENIISGPRAEQVVADLLDLRITRYPHFPFVPWIWEPQSFFGLRRLLCRAGGKTRRDVDHARPSTCLRSKTIGEDRSFLRNAAL